MKNGRVLSSPKILTQFHLEVNFGRSLIADNNMQTLNFFLHSNRTGMLIQTIRVACTKIAHFFVQIDFHGVNVSFLHATQRRKNAIKLKLKCWRPLFPAIKTNELLFSFHNGSHCGVFCLVFDWGFLCLT